VRPRHVIYDELLRHQVDLSFDLESSFFRMARQWRAASTILDFGCGNAYYSQRLAERHPEKRFICVEKDAELAALAAARLRGRNIDIVPGTYTDCPDDLRFDFLLARHALSYVADRDSFVRWYTERSSAHAGALTIDANDAVFAVTPSLPLLEAGNEDFKEDVRESGGNRDLSDELPAIWARHGFAHGFTSQLLVHSDMRDRKYLMYMFMKAVAEIDHGSPLPDQVRNEVDSWAADPDSYLQYGLFATYFEKES